MNPSRFTAASLDDIRIQRILAAAIDAVSPGILVRDWLHHVPKVRGRSYAIGIGKAAQSMTEAVAEKIALAEALVITKHATGPAREGFVVMEGGHPIPNQQSIEAGRAALELASKATPDDVLICLISGGGSALACAPVEGVDLDDLQRLNAQLLASGAGIEEINALRRQVDKLKGGGLAAGTRAQVVALVLSDVVGNAVEHVASGPTALDVENPVDPLAVQRKYSMELPAAASSRTGLRRIGQTIAADGRVRNFVIGDVQTAARAALAQAEVEGFQGSLMDAKMRGEARQIGMQMGSRLADLASNARSRPFCFIGAGETTVSLQGKGRGGRNQEMALAAVETLTGAADALLITLATDGEDGPTDAAGAVVTGETLRRGRELGLHVEEHLAENNSYSYFDALGDLLRPGPTGTNVSDLVLLAGR